MENDISRIPYNGLISEFPSHVNKAIYEIEGELIKLHLRMEQFEQNLPNIMATATLEALSEYLNIDKKESKIESTNDTSFNE